MSCTVPYHPHPAQQLLKPIPPGAQSDPSRRSSLRSEALLAQAILGQADFDTEFRVIHPDGSIHFIKSYGLVQWDEQARPCNMIGINFDITAAKCDEANRHQTEVTIRQQAEREFVLREMTQRIRKSLELPIVFETAVREIREFMQTDRVGIFKFYVDSHHEEGEFVAESVGAEFESILGAKLHDPCFAEQLVGYYQQDRINVVEDIYAAGLQDCEVQILASFQVRANLVVPLLDGPELWGLLCIHHCVAPRSWQPIEVDFIKHIAEQIGIAIQQATLYAKVQLELGVRWQAEAGDRPATPPAASFGVHRPADSQLIASRRYPRHCDHPSQGIDESRSGDDFSGFSRSQNSGGRRMCRPNLPWLGRFKLGTRTI